MRIIFLITMMLLAGCTNQGGVESQAFATAEGVNLLTCEPRGTPTNLRYRFALNVVRTAEARLVLQFLQWSPQAKDHLKVSKEISINNASLLGNRDAFILTDNQKEGYVHLYDSTIDPKGRSLVDIYLGGGYQDNFNSNGPVTNPDIECSRNGGE